MSVFSQWLHDVDDVTVAAWRSPAQAFASAPGISVPAVAVLWQWDGQVQVDQDGTVTPARLAVHGPVQGSWRVFNYSRGWEQATVGQRREGLLYEYDDNAPLSACSTLDVISHYAASFEEGLAPVPALKGDLDDPSWPPRGPARFSNMSSRLLLAVSLVCELVHRHPDAQAVRTVLALSFPTTLTLVDDYPFAALAPFTALPGKGPVLPG